MTNRFLFITHQLSRTGAPLALLNVIRLLHDEGNMIDVISLSEGELRDELSDMDIPVSIEDKMLSRWEEYISIFKSYDCVFLNTILTYEAVHILNYTKVPAIWWIHEPEEYFDAMKEVLPDLKELNDNIHIFAVSNLTKNVIEKNYNIKAPILTPGTFESAIEEKKEKDNLKIRFLTTGLYSYSKGQDILISAIDLLPDDVKEGCEFLFCGDEKRSDKNFFKRVKEKEGNGIKILGALSHSELLSYTASADFIITPSRIDSLSSVTAEALMLKIPVIISDACGITDFMNGKEGYIFPAEDVNALKNKITEAFYLLQPSKETGKKALKYEEMRSQARKTYEENFSGEAFKSRLKSILKDILPIKRLVFLNGGNDILDFFGKELSDAFTDMGYETFLFDCRDLVNTLSGFLDFIKKGNIKAVLTFNFYSAFLELKEGENIWKSLNIPVITYLMDHPFCFHEALLSAGENDIILCPDKNHMNYVSRFYKRIPTVGYLGHGGSAKKKDIKPIAERSIEVFYAGGISRPNIDRVMPDFNKFNFDAKALGEEAYEYLISHPSCTTEEVLEMKLLEHGIEFSDEELRGVISDMHYVDLLAVSYFREKTIKTLSDAGIPLTLCGFGWEKLDWIKSSKIDFRGRVPAYDVTNYMTDSKIVLSTMTWFKDGTHDRVFNGMLNGAFSITDTSIYMEEEFKGLYPGDERNISILPEVGFFRLEEIEKLPDMIKYLLDNEDLLQRLADTGRKKAKSHDWAARAREIDHDLLLYM